MNKKELIIISILIIILAFMDITGIPSVLFIKVNVLDINPIFPTLIVNFILIGAITFLVLKYLCLDWKLGLKANATLKGLKDYGLAGAIVGVVSFIAFYIGLQPFNSKPSILKIIIEGIIYYIGVAAVEELYIRGLFLNLIEKIFHKNSNKTAIAIILSSFIFGLGHIYGVLGQPLLIIFSKVI